RQTSHSLPTPHLCGPLAGQRIRPHPVLSGHARRWRHGMSNTAVSGERPLIETRSIDYVPPSERHGKVWHQAPFWFTGNFVLVTMVSGFVGPSLGLSLGWTCLAIVLGAGFGTFFMAFHANQGPTMGLPQMIQSRAQFGSRSAILPFAATVFVYVGFLVFDTI